MEHPMTNWWKNGWELGVPLWLRKPPYSIHIQKIHPILSCHIYIYRYGVSCYPVGNEHSSGKSPLSHGENHRTKWAMFNSKLLVYLRWIPSEIRWKNPIEHHEIPKSSIFIGGSIWNPIDISIHIPWFQAPRKAWSHPTTCRRSRGWPCLGQLELVIYGSIHF